MNPVDLKPPLKKRHLITHITKKSWNRSVVTTVIEPKYWQDVLDDIEAIKLGDGTQNGDDYLINDRVYRGEEQRFYPVSGIGFHRIGPRAFRALQIYNSYGGDTKKARREINLNPSITVELAEQAYELWILGKEQSNDN